MTPQEQEQREASTLLLQTRSVAFATAGGRTVWVRLLVAVPFQASKQKNRNKVSRCGKGSVK